MTFKVSSLQLDNIFQLRWHYVIGHKIQIFLGTGFSQTCISGGKYLAMSASQPSSEYLSGTNDSHIGLRRCTRSK